MTISNSPSHCKFKFRWYDCHKLRAYQVNYTYTPSLSSRAFHLPRNFSKNSHLSPTVLCYLALATLVTRILSYFLRHVAQGRPIHRVIELEFSMGDLSAFTSDQHVYRCLAYMPTNFFMFHCQVRVFWWRNATRVYETLELLPGC